MPCGMRCDGFSPGGVQDANRAYWCRASDKQLAAILAHGQPQRCTHCWDGPLDLTRD